ncbi:Tim44 domain-containing protein [uncultured Oxalicibacterium sp.]|uniref:Tim44 domain-containing protein n=1 Tax=uncultured Oxalicibacterium sp. TaxID=1168540 RepID=UPI0025DCCC97|nr:Tim44-like domain-containing protein [uncultured Oxalicibacterium sp.]
MKKLLLVMAVLVSSMTFVATEVQAKRMGGGGSFGKQSQSFQRPAPAQQSSSAANSAQRPAAAPAAAGAGAAGAAAAKPSMMRNILGGALLGLGLGALLSHFGIGGALASMISTILMIALFAFAAMFIYRMIKARSGNNGAQPSFANGYSAKSSTPEIGSGLNGYNQPQSAQPAALQGAALGGGAAVAAEVDDRVPADFDVESFLRNSKTYFIRLQAAWDRADVQDIREFTTPEMFAELKMQLTERGASENHTDVVQLNAEFYGVETVGNDYIASVKFSGLIRESQDTPTQPFTEAWNLSKPVNGNGGWVLAGIQQLPE